MIVAAVLEKSPKATLAEGPSGGSARGVSPVLRKILGLENAVDAISDAEKPISQRVSERTI
jgi:hypothetical protein